MVTTYNRPDALALVLQGFADQSDRDFELLVADDGSRDDTAAVVTAASRSAPFPVAHVWQEDLGFRAPAVRNRAVAATPAEYVVFTDGDCVPSRTLVARHRRLAQTGWFVAGSRVGLGARLTRLVVDRQAPIQRWGLGRWVEARLKGDVRRLLPLVALPLRGSWRTATPRRWKGLVSFNLAVWREDLERVNGFDESFEGWGREDTDLIVRLLMAGVRYKSGRLAIPVFHLWHPPADRSRLEENTRRLEEVWTSRRTRARFGLDRYHGEGTDTRS